MSQIVETKVKSIYVVQIKHYYKIRVYYGFR